MAVPVLGLIRCNCDRCDGVSESKVKLSRLQPVQCFLCAVPRCSVCGRSCAATKRVAKRAVRFVRCNISLASRQKSAHAVARGFSRHPNDGASASQSKPATSYPARRSTVSRAALALGLSSANATSPSGQNCDGMALSAFMDGDTPRIGTSPNWQMKMSNWLNPPNFCHAMFCLHPDLAPVPRKYKAVMNLATWHANLTRPGKTQCFRRHNVTET